MGLVVDVVSEVLSINNEDIEDVSALRGKVDTGFIYDVAKIVNGVKR